MLQLPLIWRYANARSSLTGSVPREDILLLVESIESHHTAANQNHTEVDLDIVSYNALRSRCSKKRGYQSPWREIIETFPVLRSVPSVSILIILICFNWSWVLPYHTAAQMPVTKEISSRLNVGKWTMRRSGASFGVPPLVLHQLPLDDLARFDFRGKLAKPKIEQI